MQTLAERPLARLISRLKTEELPRVRKLNPQRYVIAVSNPLSPRDKQSISDALSPHIARPDDIYGREDINDLLRAHPEVERRHYKLWIRSTGVLKHLLRKGLYDRSQFALEEILESSKRYVRTLNHDKALTVLEKYRILIIAGEPGIGKTTLAEQICCDYIADSYSLVKIADSIHEAEDSFENEENQIFLFDDFLGRNYLEALGGHEGSHIVQFIRRIQKSNNKLFVLTSRSTILNRGKMLIDTFQHHNLERNEYVLTIASLSEFEKAKILYNHVWFSGLTEEYVEEIYKERRYRKIIGHRNFNPRLIRFVTDRDRLSNCPPSKYWARIEKSLSNPADVWENPFVAQQDDYGRALVLLVTVNRRALSEEQLAAAFSLYVDASPPLNGSFDFVGSIRQLTGSLLSRTIQHGSQPQIDLFNPSIGDYVLRRYASDTAALTMAISSLRTPQALRTLRALADAKIISESATQTILEGLLDSAIAAQFVGFEEGYVSEAAWMFIKGNAESKEPSEEIKEVLEFLLSGDVPSDCTSIACLYRWGIQHALVPRRPPQNPPLVAGSKSPTWR
jgi:adenylate kinase family enzyme